VAFSSWENLAAWPLVRTGINQGNSPIDEIARRIQNKSPQA
jgi:hypothetical protein